MAKRCPETGEMKLYLDCMECEDRYQCGGSARSRNREMGSMSAESAF